MAITFNLTTLGLAQGTHTITVKAKGNYWQDSPASTAVTYSILSEAPTVEQNDDGTINLYANEDTAAFNVYVDGELKDTISVVNEISFTIDGTTYQAEEGMDFGDWIASSYNTDGFSGTETVKATNGKLVAKGNDKVSINTVITSGYAYSLISSSSSGPTLD